MAAGTLLTPGSASAADADSVRSPLLVGAAGAVAMAVLLVLWASMMSVSGGAIAPGHVALEGNRKAVQHRDGGAIRRVLVREGEKVEKGQPLLELNLAEVQAEATVLSSSRIAAIVRLARLRAEARDEGVVTWPNVALSAKDMAQLQSIIEQEAVLFEARRAAYRNNVSLLRQQIEGRHRQIEAQRGRLSAAQTQLTSIDQELETLRPLVEKGLIPKPRTLALERNSASLRGDLESIQAAIAGEESNIAQALTQIAQLEKDRSESIARDTAEAEARYSEIAPRLDSALDRLDRSVLVAPEAGTVYGLSAFNTGGVVVPGQTVLEIVPTTDSLVLSVEINPNDVERVRPGQTVVVHLLAYSQRYQQVIKGRLEKVSADRFEDKVRGRSYYGGIVRTDAEELSRAGVALVPGMPVNVVIETGERSIMSYLLDPVFRITDFAFRER